MDWQTWIQQSLPRTENLRGGAAVWAKGAQRLTGDALGPVMHLHDGASEIFYFVSGACRLEVGEREEYFSAGDFVLVPPGVPHNLWNAGDDDLLVFWLVAPHKMDNKWRTQGITPEEMQLGVIRSRVTPGAALPGDENIDSRLVQLRAGERLEEQTQAGQEAVLYLQSGQAQVQVGKLSGVLGAHEFVHVPAGTGFSVETRSVEVTLLLFRCPGRQARSEE